MVAASAGHHAVCSAWHAQAASTVKAATVNGASSER